MRKLQKMMWMLLAASVISFVGCNNAEDDEFGPEPPTGGGGTEEGVIYSENFAKTIGAFKNYSVSGTDTFAIDSYGYAKVSGFSNGVNNANDLWFISPTIDLSAVDSAYTAFEYVFRYGGSANDITFCITENLTSNDAGIWTNLDFDAKIVGDWNAWTTPKIDLTSYAGKKIRLAFHYTSTTIKAGTWEVKNFTVNKGSIKEPTTPPATGEGSSAENAYTVANAITKQGTDGVWVKGYIVGCVEKGDFTEANTNFAGPWSATTNVFIADSKDETDPMKCINVKLNDTGVPADFRDACSLGNAQNKGKLLAVKGNLTPTFTVLPGVRSASEFQLEGYTPGGGGTESGDFNVAEIDIPTLRAMYKGTTLTLTDNKKIVGVVISDKAGGNSTSLKNIVVAALDNKSGLTIRFKTDADYLLGEKIEILINSATLEVYNEGSIQLNNVVLANSRSVAKNVPVVAQSTTVADLNANMAKYESTLVVVEGTIKAANSTGKYGVSSDHTTNKIESNGAEIESFVAKYSAFVGELVPTGVKTITGIAGLNAGKTQLNIRNTADVK